jgi:protoporphyrinogen oxidase
MPEALAKNLHVVYEADVQSVAEAANGGVNLSYKDSQGESHLLHADAAIVATTYDVAERIYPALPTYAGDYAKTLKFVPLISISLAYGQATKSKAYAVLIPTVEQPDILLMFLQQNKSPDRAPAGSSLITLYTDPLAAPRLFPQSDAALTAWAQQEVERFFPELAGHFKFATVSSWPVSGYTAAPGFWRRTRAFRAALPTNTSIQLGGDVFGAGSMESAVAWGVRAAGQVIDHYEASGNQQKISRSEPV